MSWRLTRDHGAMTQALLVSGFSHLPFGRALLLRQDRAGTGWLKTLARLAPPTPADGAVRDRCSALAFTHTGLAALGIEAQGPAAAPDPFREGMFQRDRARRLNDCWRDEWTDSVLPGGPTWSGNPAGDAMQTADTVHALVALYAASDAEGEAWATALTQALAADGVNVVKTFPLDLRPDERGIYREHFGFADGISQPLPYDAAPDVASPVVVDDGGAPVSADRVHGVALGELLFGHWNGHHEDAPGPMLDGDSTRALNGSYLVVREYRQDVAGFWESMAEAADAINAADPDAHASAEQLAERVIGRTIDGAMLCPAGALSPDDNGFTYFDTDRGGRGCPLGSHARRGNPRDGLATRPEQKEVLLAATNRHRILRRARKFGPGLAPHAPDDGAERGLLFLAFNTDIQRQFEFIQQTWVMNPNFATLYDELDPLIGPAGPMSLRDRPLRHIVPVKTYVRLAGGEYFFLPSLPTFAWMASR